MGIVYPDLIIHGCEVHRLAVFIVYVFLQKYVKKQNKYAILRAFHNQSYMLFDDLTFFVSCWDAEPFCHFIFFLLVCFART